MHWGLAARGPARMPTKAKIHITIICVAGLGMALWQTVHWDTVELARFIAYTRMAVLASCLKVRLPGLYGTMSVNFCFILIAITQLSLPETITMSCLATLAQCLWNTKSPPRLIQVLFSLGSISLAVWATYEVRWGYTGFWALAPTWLRIIASACTYFVTNTL